MPYSKRLETLKESHRLIDLTIIEKSTDVSFDPFKLAELKKQKLLYKDEISKLEQIQQDYHKDMTHE